MRILRIAEGTEARPKPAIATTPTETEICAIEDWDRRNDEGLGLIQLTVKAHIRKYIRENETLAENWTRLQETYGTQSGLNLWVDINRYFAMSFSPKTPFTQQINEMSELKARIESARIPIADNLHAMLILRALPPAYEITQQKILANIRDCKTLTSNNMRSCILAEELQQTTATVNAIQPKKNSGCNWCGGAGHWERDCRRKLRGL